MLKEGATREDMDALKKNVAEIAEEIKKSATAQDERIVEAVKAALANHPGFTPREEMKFEQTGMIGLEPAMRVRKITEKMPKALQEQIDNVFILSAMLKKNPKQLKSWQGFAQDLGDFKKALDTADAGGGGDWVPTDFSSQLYEFVRLETQVAALFPTIAMPSNPYPIPVQIGRLDTFKVTEQTANTGQTKVTVGDNTDLTDKTTLTAVGHGSRVLTSKYLEEDSIIPILPLLRQELITALAEGRENCIMNGDTGGSHEDSDISSADDKRKMWLGLRRLANANSYKTDLSTLTLTTLRGMRKNMGKYGVAPSRLAYITGIAGYIKLLSLGEVITIDKYGPNATILSGELGKLDGIPVVVSGWVREVLNASAVYQSGQTKTVLHLVYPRGFVIGERRPARVQLLQELYAESEQDALMTTERVCFAPVYDITLNRITEMGHNIDA